MNRKLLKAKMVMNNHTIGSISKELNVNRDTVSRWINEQSAMPLWAAIKISEILNLSDLEIIEIFVRGGEVDE